MSASREGFDLFSPWGRRHFLRRLRRGQFPRLVWWDTFGRCACWVRGHDRYDVNYGMGTPEIACRRCCRYLLEPPR